MLASAASMFIVGSIPIWGWVMDHYKGEVKAPSMEMKLGYY